MTSSRNGRRPRACDRSRPRDRSHISLRVAWAALGGTSAAVWLVLPVMTTPADAPVAITRTAPAAGAAAAQQDETDPVDLALPLLAAGAAVVLGGYAYVRRTRRARSRTTPGAGAAPAPPRAAVGVLLPRPYVPTPDELDAQARAALVEADDCVRASGEELVFAEACCGAPAVEPFARAVREAEAELSAALRIRQRYDEGVPAGEAARRQALAGIVGRCAEAGRRLDTEAAAWDTLRDLDRDPGRALGAAEARFRAQTARTGSAQALLEESGKRYPPAASAAVTGYVEQAKDRLVFATARLNGARQAADRGDAGRAAGELRCAEAAVVQADVLLTAVFRLARELDSAGDLLPAVLTGAEAELAAVRAPGALPGVPPGALRSRVMHADAVLASVRQEVTGGRAFDPLDALRRIVRALAPLATGRTGVLGAAARLTARSTTAAAADFLGTHRAAVGADARTRLAAARALLDADGLPGLVEADDLARASRDLAEGDVHLHGNPAPGRSGQETGAAGALIGGVLPPRGFGGPATRDRHRRPETEPPSDLRGGGATGLPG
ncbi:hypothetical protein ACL02U_05645 [Streptomyces sp. MS06]|uniref:hypothetical protein n=1 Tax=Streptomyces sp. MS06 TaxID=3385974 RepID=UPI0039A33633